LGFNLLIYARTIPQKPDYVLCHPILKFKTETSFAGELPRVFRVEEDMSLRQDIQTLYDSFPETDTTQPALFVGHGNPMNAIEDNPYSLGWEAMGRALPVPKAIVCVSAHWETRGTFLTASETPQTIHDFGGFPQALFDVQYPAPGSPLLAELTHHALTPQADAGLTQDWGLDHGAWSVLCRMFPEARVPVVQLSLDATQPADFHFTLGQELQKLRKRGVLLVGSGNIVHNLRRAIWQDIAADWAVEFDEVSRERIATGDNAALIGYETLGEAARLSIPTPEHYLPLLYILGARKPDEPVMFFNEGVTLNSISMRSLRLG
jgi:4,5-DOPA dioxygenase extradiol